VRRRITLTDEDGTWLISGFWRSHVQTCFRGSSRVINGGGTDAYAPPEIDNVDERFSQRYDVWSLGCITLEVLAFVVLGYAGLSGKDGTAGLDQLRRSTSTWSRRTDERFFSQKARNGPYTIKEEITKFIADLNRSERASDKKSQEFLSKIIGLVKKMLEPNVEDRIEIEEVIRRLQQAIRQASPTGTPGQLLQSVAAKGERPIGDADLSGVHLWRQVAGDEGWLDSSLQAFEDINGNIRTYCVTDNSLNSEAYLKRRHDRLIPRYAFYTNLRAQATDQCIYFANNSHTGPQTYPG
jgi:serine/threonine protein kinase